MDTTTREALIRDLAMVLDGALHPDAKLGPSARWAARRLRDALGITGGELDAGIEDKLSAALGIKEG